MSDEKARGLDFTHKRLSPSDEGLPPPAAEGDRRSPGRPLATIWTRPRETIRRILESDPSYLVIPLSLAAGVAKVLDAASWRHDGGRLQMPTILAMAMIFGPLTGVFGLYLAGWLLSWSGRVLGGVAEPEATRAALAWSLVPTVASLTVSAVQLAFLGDAMFRNSPGPAAGTGRFLLATWAIHIFLGVWSLLLLLIGLSEAHRISMARALGAFLLAGFVLLIASIVVNFGFLLSRLV
ncbi:Yip1 family protein [Paludisphaera soli]|uniref:Yip1 family protein n=1 Tax=Paludisphaera soli TaxID=2712865 RepID=UPI001F1006C6|nr:Yip1 family protein [Paludisphaera soli]